MNFAGVVDTPTIFFCNNNQWAISVPQERQTASATFAQKADAYGFDGVQVDGMDPLATYVVTNVARTKAIDPDTDRLRPTLIEAVQYRFGARRRTIRPSTVTKPKSKSGASAIRSPDSNRICGTAGSSMTN